MTPLERAVLKTLRNPALFSRHILGRPLRPYQEEPLRAILSSIAERRGLTFTLMFARQMGKNEASAHLEAYLLNRYARRGGSIVKTAPTYSPQLINSKLRLLTMLNNPLNRSDWRQSDGHVIVLGAARCEFFSGSPEASVLGATASLLLEVDEAQDFDETKYARDFRPMASSTNATTVMYGTAWTGDTLLEHQIAANRDAEQRDQIRRHFQYDWQTLAEINPDYRRFVEAERARLGEEHPLFRTQYKLEPISGANRLLSAAQLAQLRGHHARQPGPIAGRCYVAGIDLAGEDEQDMSTVLSARTPRHDSVVVTIAELTHSPVDIVQEPRLNVVNHYTWTGRKQSDLYQTLIDILRNVWQCSRVVVDATGVGAGVAGFLASALGAHIVEQFIFTAPSKSALGYDLLSAVNAGRLKVYDQNAETVVIDDFWRQMRAARYDMRANQTMSFYVPESDGHDDYLMSLALCNRAGSPAYVAPAAAAINRPPEYADGRY